MYLQRLNNYVPITDRSGVTEHGTAGILLDNAGNYVCGILELPALSDNSKISRNHVNPKKKDIKTSGRGRISSGVHILAVTPSQDARDHGFPRATTVDSTFCFEVLERPLVSWVQYLKQQTIPDMKPAANSKLIIRGCARKLADVFTTAYQSESASYAVPAYYGPVRVNITPDHGKSRTITVEGSDLFRSIVKADASMINDAMCTFTDVTGTEQKYRILESDLDASVKNFSPGYRSGIRFHAGSVPTHSDGCLLVGCWLDADGSVVRNSAQVPIRWLPYSNGSLDMSNVMDAIGSSFDDHVAILAVANPDQSLSLIRDIVQMIEAGTFTGPADDVKRDRTPLALVPQNVKTPSSDDHFLSAQAIITDDTFKV